MLLAMAAVGCASAAAPPSIEGEAASNITPTDATLEAQINPGDLETTYEVMLEAPSCESVNPPGSCEASGGVEVASGSIPAGASAQTVSVDLAQVWHDLSPSTSYAYFFRATNSAGEDNGHQKEFTTPAGAPPSIEGEAASNITPTDATLEAQINPGDGERGAYYQFQLVADASEFPPEMQCPPEPGGALPCVGPQATSALPIGFVPSGAEPHAVSLDLASVGVVLRPSMTYHYRVLAAPAAMTEDTIQWDAPTVFGPDQAFRTASEPPPSPAQAGGSPGEQPLTSQSSAAMPNHHRGRHHRRKHIRRRHRGVVHQASLVG
jgi:hypothetical protein